MAKIYSKNVKEEESFNKIAKLYKNFFKNDQLIKIKNFHTYAFRENIYFKSFYLNNNFVGFVKGFKKDDFLYISWFAYVDEKYKDPIIKKIKSENLNRNIIFILRSETELPTYIKNDFSKVNVSKFFAIGNYVLVALNTKINEEKIVEGIKENDWPLMFGNSKPCFIYYSNVQNLNIEKEINNLPTIRKEKANRLKFEPDKKQSIGSYLLLKKALALHHIKIENYEYLVEENGKPYLKNCPYNFSISHSGDYVAVAVSKAQIGVDIEKIRELDLKIINQISSEKDLEYFDNSSDKKDTFFKIWTFKEAFVKKTGEGISSKIKDIYINYLFKFNGSFFYEYNKIKGYKIAVASSEYKINEPKELKIFAQE